MHTCMHVRMSIYPSIYLSACLPTYLYINLPVRLSIYLPTSLLFCLSISISIYLFGCLSIHVSIYLTACMPICLLNLKICQSIFMLIRLFNYVICLQIQGHRHVGSPICHSSDRRARPMLQVAPDSNQHDLPNPAPRIPNTLKPNPKAPSM